MPSVEELINAGPSGTTDNNPPPRQGDITANDNTAIDVDSFDKIRVEGLDPELAKQLAAEEEKATKNEAQKKSGSDSDNSTSPKVDESNNEESDEKVDEKTQKDTTETKDKDTSNKVSDKASETDLLHLELGISPAQANFLKKMDKSAREFVVSELKTRLLTNTELKAKVKELESGVGKPENGNGLSTSWYEHPQAYHLLPEYQQKVGAINKVGELLKHYQEQKIAIKEGEVWTDLEADGNGGIQRKQYKPSSRAEALVDEKLSELRSAMQVLNSQADEVKKNFNTNAVKTREQVVGLENQYFPQYADPKVLEKNDNYKAVKNALDKFGLGNDRMANITAKMYIYAMENIEKREELENKVKELETQLKSGIKKNSNGPTGDEINRGDAKPGKKYDNPDDEPLDIGEFEKRLANR